MIDKLFHQFLNVCFAGGLDDVSCVSRQLVASIYNCNKVFFTHDQIVRTIVPKTLKEFFEIYWVSYVLFHLVQNLKSFLYVVVTSLELKVLQLFWRVKVLWELQPRYTFIQSILYFLIKRIWTLQQSLEVHTNLLLTLFTLEKLHELVVNFET